jgi:hypothetical protein
MASTKQTRWGKQDEATGIYQSLTRITETVYEPTVQEFGRRVTIQQSSMYVGNFDSYQNHPVTVLVSPENNHETYADRNCDLVEWLDANGFERWDGTQARWA